MERSGDLSKRWKHEGNETKGQPVNEPYSEELFPLGECGEVPEGSDCKALWCGCEERMDNGRGLVEVLAKRPDKYAAAVAAVRRIIARTGRKVAPLHLAFEMRCPPRGIPPVKIENELAVALARLIAEREPDLKDAFSTRFAACDALAMPPSDFCPGVEG